MRTADLANSTFLDGWRTARVSERRFAQLCIGRLDSAGLEFQVLHEERELRIVVRRPDLSFAIDLIDDIAKPTDHFNDARVDPPWATTSLLFGIPVGGLFGSMAAHVVGISTIPICVAGTIFGSVAAVVLESLIGRMRENSI